MKSDKEPITLSVKAVTKDGEEQRLQLDQKGNVLAGNGDNAENQDPGSEGAKTKDAATTG